MKMVYYSTAGDQSNEGEYSFYSSINQDGRDAYWAQIAEATIPLKQSKMSSANRDYTQLNGNRGSGDPSHANNGGHQSFQASVELSAKEISNKLIAVNAISLFVNLVLAVIAFYFAFINNSSATSAFAADCVLDFISSAIVLWRYCGDGLSSYYRHAREQIACIYLGALFEISAIGIIVKASSDIAGGIDLDDMFEVGPAGFDLVYLAIAATIACSVLTVFKCALYKTIRDNSILLDVINTLISTVFAMSIIMSQALININPSFWYMDPVISILLALFMAAFGLKVIHQNLNILRPVYRSTSNHSLLRSISSSNHINGGAAYRPNKSFHVDQSLFTPRPVDIQRVDQMGGHHFGANLNASIEFTRNQVASDAGDAIQNNWQKCDTSKVSFV